MKQSIKQLKEMLTKADNILNKESGLKAYIGCKIIQATPMSKEEFYTKVKNDPYDNSEDADGYMVVYPDGYKSWSPKRVFEEAYREVSPQEKELIG